MQIQPRWLQDWAFAFNVRFQLGYLFFKVGNTFLFLRTIYDKLF